MAKYYEFKKFRAALGPVEQAQIVISASVVVTLITIWALRKTSGHTVDWLLFGSVLTVGIFGFIIVFFTLKYGRLLEEQKQELQALNTFAESVNRAIDVRFLLERGLQEVQRLLDVEFGWIYRIEGDRLLLSATQGTPEMHTGIVDSPADIRDEKLSWIRTPRIVQRPGKSRPDAPVPWDYGLIASWSSVPVMMKDQIAGLIVVASRNRDAFTIKQVDLMSAFANQIGIALENATLFDRVRKSEERYIDLFEHSPDMSHIVNRDGIIISCNETEAARLGYRKEELIGESLMKLYLPEHREEALRILNDIFARNREIKGLEEKICAKSGEVIDVSVNASIIHEEGGQPFVRAVARDITEKKKLEDKVIHAQRIDSIGNLAGGVSHDFNNILTSILGSTAIMKRKMTHDDQWYRFVDIIETAARRGASLTRQLLTFARKSNIHFRPVVVNDIIMETLRLFERSIDKTIAIEPKLTENVCIISGDDGQLQQSLLNLLINARDAMPNGGAITVRSSRVQMEEDALATPEIRKGEYAVISIADTGVGMDKRIQQHIFEPFFTTKDQGKGTGLGLSVVYGVVNSHNGFITVQTELNKGSQFNLHFPVLEAAEELKAETRPAVKLERGTENILVVDDERDVAEVISGMLENLGYHVTRVDSGRKAVNLYRKKKRFDLVILDLNMPRMSGKDTFLQLREIDSNVRVLISTGYSDRAMDISSWRDSINAFLQKPYQIEELSKTIRLVLSSKGAAAA